MLLGGEPFAKKVLLWWNFIARGEEEIVAAIDDWNTYSPRFGEVKD
jgi:quercetin 2,3-dioxygenase